MPTTTDYNMDTASRTELKGKLEALLIRTARLQQDDEFTDLVNAHPVLNILWDNLDHCTDLAADILGDNVKGEEEWAEGVLEEAEATLFLLTDSQLRDNVHLMEKYPRIRTSKEEA